MGIPAAAAAAAGTAGTAAGTATGTATAGSIAAGASATTGAFNLLSNIGFGIYDRIHNREIEQANQANFNANLAFQKEQFQFQKDIQEMNRIGNLTKEYTEAGLNPLLAAGMGMSTAGTLSGAGTSGNHAIQPHSKVEANIDNLLKSFQLSMQKDLNDATINKLNAEANLSNTQAEDISATRELRIDKLISENYLTDKQATQVVITTDKIAREVEKTNAEIGKINDERIAQQIENILQIEYGEKLKKNQVEKLNEEIKSSKHGRVIKTWGEVRNWIDTILSNGIKAGWLALGMYNH